MLPLVVAVEMKILGLFFGPKVNFTHQIYGVIDRDSIRNRITTTQAGSTWGMRFAFGSLSLVLLGMGWRYMPQSLSKYHSNASKHL